MTGEDNSCGNPDDEPRTASGYVVSDDVLTAELEEEAVLLHMGTKRYYRLNETGSCIWKGLQEQLCHRELIGNLQETFEVDAAEAEEELATFLAHLDAQGLLDKSRDLSSEEEPKDQCDEAGSD